MSSPEEIEDQNKHNKCMGRMEEAINKNSMVNHLLDSISSMGCEIPKDFFSCIKCEQKNITGGFIQPSTVNSTDYKPKLLMNESVDISKKVFETTIVHELIHAYDICRAKTNAHNCQHSACMEIRASALSGECGIFEEYWSGRGKASGNVLRGGHKECVKRRAALSLSCSPICKDTCKDDIMDVLEQCYNDTAPFQFPR